MKTINKFLAVILSLALFISVCPLGVFTFTASAATYSGTCGENLTWAYDDSTYTLTISGTGAMNVYDCYYDYDYSSDVTTAPWQSYYNVMKTLVIGSGVTSIGDWAFYGCSGLTSVTIGNSVTSIGLAAFFGCSGLTSITIPNSVTTIGPSAFSGCSGLTSITIPDSVTSIFNGAFHGTAWYNNQPDGLVYAGKVAYEYKGKDKKGICPGSVTIIDGTLGIAGRAFSGCSGLTSITIPDSVTSIGWYAFYGCKGLTSITIPDSVTSIGWCAFEDCKGLTDVYYAGTKQQKANIHIVDDNYCLLNATWHYNYGKKYTIKYTLNGGTNNKSNPTSYTVESGSFTLKNPTKTGYKFEGWYKDSAFKSKITTISKGTAKNVTVYAKWSKITYKITYKLNGGKNGKKPASYNVTTATITFKNPTKKGYKFGGWYSDSNYKTKVTKITKGTAKNITLYAKWSKVTYKITYKLNKGKNGKNPKTYTVTTSTIKLKNPTRKGYTFKGWYTDAKFKKKVTKIAKGSTGNKTLYAKWAKKK